MKYSTFIFNLLFVPFIAAATIPSINTVNPLINSLYTTNPHDILIYKNFNVPSLRVVQLLLNFKFLQAEEALFEAIKRDSIPDIIRALKNGASLTITRNGLRPFDYAIQCRCWNAVAYLANNEPHYFIR